MQINLRKQQAWVLSNSTDLSPTANNEPNSTNTHTLYAEENHHHTPISLSLCLSLTHSLTHSLSLSLVKNTYPSTGDGTKLGELVPQTLIINAIIQVLHVQVDTLVAIDAVYLESLKFVLKLGLALVLLLCAAHVHRLIVDLGAVQLVDSLRVRKK